jgi:hypothetical protein
MMRHSLPMLFVMVLMILLTAGCHKQETPSPVSSSGVAGPSNPHIAPQMQQGRMTRINGMQAAARQRGQMMHRAPGKP